MLFSHILFSWKVLCSSMDSGSPLFHQDIAISSNLGGPFVYGFIDLFSGSGESWNWGFGLDENNGINSSVPPNTMIGSKIADKVQEKYVRPLVSEDKKDSLHSTMTKLRTLEEESEEGDKHISSTDSSISSMENLVEIGGRGEEEVYNLDVVLVFEYCLYIHLYCCFFLQKFSALTFDGWESNVSFFIKFPSWLSLITYSLSFSIYLLSYITLSYQT